MSLLDAQIARDGRRCAEIIMAQARAHGFSRGSVPATDKHDYPSPDVAHDGVVVQLAKDRPVRLSVCRGGSIDCGQCWELRAGRIDVVLAIMTAVHNKQERGGVDLDALD